MTIRQISVFMENKPGMLLSVTEALAKAGVDVRALSLADTQDFGILRLIVDDTDKAYKALSGIGCVMSVTEVLAAVVPDEPGAMTEIIRRVSETKLNIEYMYAFVSHYGKKAFIVLRIKDIDSASAVLNKNGIILAGEKDIV